MLIRKFITLEQFFLLRITTTFLKKKRSLIRQILLSPISVIDQKERFINLKVLQIFLLIKSTHRFSLVTKLYTHFTQLFR